MTVYSKYTCALTFKNICKADALEAKAHLKTKLDGVLAQLEAAQQRTAFLDQALATAQVKLLKDKEITRRDSLQGDPTTRMTSSMSPSQRKKQWEAQETLRLSSNSPPADSPTAALPRWAQEDLNRAQKGGGGRESLLGTTFESPVNTSLSLAVREESGSALVHTAEAKVWPRGSQAGEGRDVPLPGGGTNRPTMEQMRPTTEQKSQADTPDTRHKGIADAQPTTEQKRPSTEQKSPAERPGIRDKSTDKGIADAQEEQEGQESLRRLGKFVTSPRTCFKQEGQESLSTLAQAEQRRREQEERSVREREAQERRRAAEVCPCVKRDLI